MEHGEQNRKQARSGRGVASCAIAALALVVIAAGAARADEQRTLAYGRHLAQECTSCHKLDGTSSAIPSIIGRPVDEFTAALKSFQAGARTNPAMVSVAQSLDDEQIKALAVYFASLR